MDRAEKSEIKKRIDAGIFMAENVFAKNMKYWRKQLGWTQQRMADEVGISRKHYGDIERGLILPERRTSLSFVYVITCNL